MDDVVTAPAEPKKSVLFVDLSALFWAAYFGSADQPVSDLIAKVLQQVEKCKTVAHADYTAICCDSPKSWRKDKAPSYKANREKKTSESIELIRRLQQKLLDAGELLWVADGFEADDVIATAATIAVNDRGHTVVIATHDKDLVQLACEEVTFFKTNTWDLVTSEQALQKFGVKASQVGDWLALTGDASDAIKGCPGCGPVKATKLLQALGTLDGVMKAGTPFLMGLVGKSVVEGLAANDEAIMLGRELIALRTDVPIDFDELYQERTPRAPESTTTDAPGLDEDPPREQAAVTAAPPASPESVTPDSVSTPEAPPRTNALVNRNPAFMGFTDGFKPTTIESLWWLAQRIVASRMYLKFPSPESAMIVMMTGMEWGMSPIEAMRSFHNIDGSPCPLAHVVIDRAMRHPDCEYFYCKETSAESATYVTKHRGNPSEQSLTYTIAQATAAGLIRTGPNGGKNQWMKHPDDMLRKTAASKLITMVYPGVKQGMSTYEEMGGSD